MEKQIEEWVSGTLHSPGLEQGGPGRLGRGYDRLGASKLLLSLAF